METLTLKAETSRLLDLVVHSLYTKPEVFLRELLSNASDALDRFHLEGMVRPELRDDSAVLEVRLEVDAQARTLTIRDNGIGMSRAEVVDHIGTIARSGTKEHEARLRSQLDSPGEIDLIGRFGVGFYSCFMVANRVTLVTRRADEPRGTRWESDGNVQYTVEDAGEVPRGTAVTVHLKPLDPEGVIEDYTNRWVLERIVKRYADFVTYPIVYVGPTQYGEAGGESVDLAAVSTILNSRKPIWMRPPAAVSDEEYLEFYKNVAHDWSEPLHRMLFKAEGRTEFSALLFVPAHAAHDLYYHAAPFGLQLYSQRVLIIDSCQELLPRYLRFLKGVVDAADLPLNVSRQTLQHAQDLSRIRRWLARKILDTLDGLRATDAAKYVAIWREFGRALKEGITEDKDNRDRLVPLLLFPSSAHDSELTSLAGYVSRMKEGQEAIYYLSGESRAAIERSPQLEELRARSYEVLYLTEPVDELVTQALGEFEGRRLQSAAKGQVVLPDDESRGRTDQEFQDEVTRLAELTAFMSRHLSAKVRGVCVSKRLTVSPACLSSDEFDFSPHIGRILEGKNSTRRRTLELNAKHSLIVGLSERVQKDPADPLVAATSEILVGLALLAEGSELVEPVEFAARVEELVHGVVVGAPAES